MAHTNEDKLQFVMSFVSESKDYKSQYVDVWREVLANFIVQPSDWVTNGTSTPYSQAHGSLNHSKGIVLKDAETHKAVMTYAAHLVLTVLGDGRSEFVRAEPVGYEDAAAGKGRTVSRLLRYAFGLPGSFRSLVEAVIDMLLFGTGVVEIGWRYEETEMPVRSFDVVGGVEVDSFTRQRVTKYDDVEINPVDSADFFPDPSEYRMDRMQRCAKKFVISKGQARERVRSGFYTSAGVQSAVSNMVRSAEDSPNAYDEDFREGVDQPRDPDMHPDFVPMVGYEYWGEVPWVDDRGSSRRVLTVLNGALVRDDPWPLADPDLPFRTLTINPVVGRFYGVSPAEVIRYDQDLQDALKVLLAEAVIRQVHPPIAYDIDSEIDVARLRRWSPDAPIPVRGGPSAIGTVRYDANVFQGFNLGNVLKQGMQEASGALSVIQGAGLGVNRASATEAEITARQAFNRPELAAALLEREDLPAIARSILRRNQQFIRDSDELRLKVGEDPDPVWIGSIMGDFDVRFVGSRLSISRQQVLQAYDRLVAFAATVPGAAQQIPWDLFLREMIGHTLELPQVAGMIADPTVIRQNALLNQLASPSPGSGNGANAPRSEPSGLAAAQAAGNLLGG